jgi:GNAT superfamily N-acetyltransferase
MEQYKAYLEESYQGESCYIDPDNRGWASYKIDGEECYINHCYLNPEFRGQTMMSELCKNIEEIAKAKGCSFMSGTVAIESTNKEKSIRMMITDGYKLHSAHNNIIVLTKEL